MRAIRYLLCCVFVVSLAEAGVTNPVVVLSGTSSRTVVTSELRPGMIVSIHSIRLEVPPLGHKVGAEALLSDGSEVRLSIQTGRDGRITVRDGSTTPGLRIQATATTNPCQDGGYSLEGIRWSTTYSWWFASGSTPSNLTVSSAESSIKSAANHITSAYNNCGLVDDVSATNAYLGRTSASPNVTNSAGCSTSDGKSVVGFGTLPSGYLGITCWWAMSSGPTSVDVKLNKAYYRWYVTKPSSCSSMWAVNAVAIHEFGHVFGLGSVSETYHPSLTMSMAIYVCQSSESTLGLGDIRGLNALY